MASCPEGDDGAYLHKKAKEVRIQRYLRYDSQAPGRPFRGDIARLAYEEIVMDEEELKEILMRIADGIMGISADTDRMARVAEIVLEKIEREDYDEEDS